MHLSTICEMQNRPRNVSFHDLPCISDLTSIRFTIVTITTTFQCSRAPVIYIVACLNWLLLVGFCKYLKGRYMELEAVLIGSKGNMV